MSPVQIAVLGALAGCTIFLGLPAGRLRAPRPTLKAMLNAVAVGILVFLLWDVLAQAWEPMDTALADRRYGSAWGTGAVLTGGVAIGLLGLVYFDRWVAGRRARAVDRAEVTTGWRSPAGQLSLMVAVGIGLHNFAEGLAIGNSAAGGELTLATLLVIGFGLHNATEGFGIVAPLAAAGVRPSVGQLAALGAIGGGPTFAGTLIGQQLVNEVVQVAFLALAAGSILYVIMELLAVGRRLSTKQVGTWGLLIGLIAGFATDAIVTAAGV
jgi:zinc transporter, ZIP family